MICWPKTEAWTMCSTFPSSSGPALYSLVWIHNFTVHSRLDFGATSQIGVKAPGKAQIVT
ncbi:hypothetical protein PILCRDRAFT_487120 [Piloderma croceum F 1598]|uniref:Uncharacterized protein n=1 Tax=Piloderma croceum (strain F 1598) TaxID=765440 RepID=A0A0C3FRF5_PILCF|nr:hypothetical protein PILCRDRAFT_487120 [Piloderma croceum F 1598]